MRAALNLPTPAAGAPSLPAWVGSWGSTRIPVTVTAATLLLRHKAALRRSSCPAAAHMLVAPLAPPTLAAVLGTGEASHQRGTSRWPPPGVGPAGPGAQPPSGAGRESVGRTAHPPRPPALPTSWRGARPQAGPGSRGGTAATVRRSAGPSCRVHAHVRPCVCLAGTAGSRGLSPTLNSFAGTAPCTGSSRDTAPGGTSGRDAISSSRYSPSGGHPPGRGRDTLQFEARGKGRPFG